MLLRRPAATALLIVVLAILVGYVLYPSLRVFQAGLVLENWRRIFASSTSANVRALVNSVSISVYTVLGAGALGTAVAYVFSRFRFPLRTLVMAIAAIPLALPPLVGVLAFLFLYGESGIIPRVIQQALNLSEVPFAFDGLWAVWLVHVYSMYVYFYLFVASSLERLDRSLLEASSDLGATGWRTFRSVIVPHITPSFVGASLLVFMISMASFTAPLLFAGTEQFLTLQIYNYKTNGSLDLSATVSTLLTAICIVFLIVLEWTRRRSPAGSGLKGVQPMKSHVTSGPLRAAVVVGVSLFSVFVALPIATIILISFAKEGSWTYQILPSAYTIQNYVKLVTDPRFIEPIRNSLVMAGIATVANVLFGVTVSVVIEKTRAPLRFLPRILSVLPFAIPGTVVAINLIVTFASPSTLSAGQILVGTFWILPLAYFIRNIPIVVRATSAALESFDDRLVEASSDLGAGSFRTFRMVVFPIIRPAILAGLLLTFVTALGEFVSSILLYVVRNRPISVEIWSQLRIYDFGAAAAYSVFLMAIIAAASFLVRRISGRPVRAI